MSLKTLSIHGLRNLIQQQFSFDPHLNFIVGPNGSGKTASLEALYLISRGRSFRATTETAHLITHGKEELTLFAKTMDDQTISLMKSSIKPTVVEINRQACLNTSELARLLPCQLIYQDMFQLIDAGAKLRRDLLDWGLFHVEHEYHLLLKKYQRGLQQRNLLLKQPVGFDQIKPWDLMLSPLAESIDKHRQAYFEALYPVFLKTLSLMTTLDCQIHYYKGFDKRGEGKNLEAVLATNYHTDKWRMFTQEGVHQADLVIGTEKAKARHYFSRGQQKIILMALKLAQITLVPKSCIILVDDLMAELDSLHSRKVLELIESMQGQFFISCKTEELPEGFASQSIRLG